MWRCPSPLHIPSLSPSLSLSLPLHARHPSSPLHAWCAGAPPPSPLHARHTSSLPTSLPYFSGTYRGGRIQRRPSLSTTSALLPANLSSPISWRRRGPRWREEVRSSGPKADLGDGALVMAAKEFVASTTPSSRCGRCKRSSTSRSSRPCPPYGRFGSGGVDPAVTRPDLVTET